MRQPGTWMRGFLADCRGVSAVEFALFAPFLFFAGVAMLDVGFAVNERMTMDRLLGSGAAGAMNDPGVAAVREIIEASAPADFAPGSEFTLSVDRFCACSAAPATAVACNTLCSGNIVPGTYYLMEAERVYSGLILPDMPLSVSAEVKIR